MTLSGVRQTRSRIYYGWVLVFVLMLVLSIGVGTSVYAYSVVAGAVEAEFAASRFMLMAGSTGMFLMIGFCSPLLGNLLDRYPSKWILASGALVMGLGFIAIALSTKLWMVVASYVLFIGVGAATLGQLATATLLTRWFERNRGLVIGIATLGTQLGGFVYPPLLAATMEAYDWRIAVGSMGLLIMLIMPVIIWFLVVDRPEAVSLSADSLAETHNEGADNPALPKTPRLSLIKLFAERNFVLVILVVGAAIVTNTTLLVNLSLFAIDLGEPAVRGSFLVSLVAVLGIFFCPFFGWLCDVINIRVVVVCVTLSLAAACLVFSISTTYPMLLIAALFLGIGGGGVFPVWASIVSQLYHVGVYGQVMGATTLFISIITALAPVLAGSVYDAAGSYQLVFILLLVILLISVACTTLIRMPEHQKSPVDRKVASMG